MNVHNAQWEVTGAEGTAEAAVTLKLEDPFQTSYTGREFM